MRASTSLRLILAVRSSILRLVLLEAASIRSIFAWLLLLPLLLTAKYISQLLIHTTHTPSLSLVVCPPLLPSSLPLSLSIARAGRHRARPGGGGMAGPRHGFPVALTRAGSDSAAARRGALPPAHHWHSDAPARAPSSGGHRHRASTPTSPSSLLLSRCSGPAAAASAGQARPPLPAPSSSLAAPSAGAVRGRSPQPDLGPPWPDPFIPPPDLVRWRPLSGVRRRGCGMGASSACAASTSPPPPSPSADNPQLRHRRESLPASPVSPLLQRA
jgi:hypothetical protein